MDYVEPNEEAQIKRQYMNAERLLTIQNIELALPAAQDVKYRKI
jgi:hypothetical protein